MGRGGRTRSNGPRGHRRASAVRLRGKRASFRRSGTPRRASRRPGGGGPTAHPGDARPSVVHVRAALSRGARPAASRQGVLGAGDQSSARHLLREIDEHLLHRPALGALVDQVSEFREILTASRAGRRPGASPLTPAELRLLPYLQTHLTIGEIGERLFVVRNTVSSEVASIYRKLASPRATTPSSRRPRSACSALGLLNRPPAPGERRRCRTRGPAPASAPRRRRGEARRPESTPTSTSTISATVAPASIAASA